MTDLFARRLVPSPDALESAVGNEVVILHLVNDTYYGLDPLGTRIWAMLKEGAPLPQIRDRLADDYDMAIDRIEADMRRFLEDLLRHDILADA